MYNCVFCNKLYSGRTSKRNLNKHLKHCIMNPNSVRYECDKCNTKFEKRQSLSAHKRFCGKKFTKKLRKKNKEKTICQYCGYISENGKKLGGHISNCNLNPNYQNRIDKLTEIGKTRKHSPETKKIISEKRIQYLKENPSKVPYLLNHSSKESYPEKYFTDLFLKENVKVEKFYQIGLYELDFCIPEKKIDIEIDGEQHFCDVKIVESDIRRTKFLEDNGWKVIRIRWSEYKKLNFENKKNYIQNLKNKIDSVPVVGRTV